MLAASGAGKLALGGGGGGGRSGETMRGCVGPAPELGRRLPGAETAGGTVDF